MDGFPRSPSTFTLLTISFFLPNFGRAFAHRVEGGVNNTRKKKRTKKEEPKTGEDPLGYIRSMAKLYG